MNSDLTQQLFDAVAHQVCQGRSLGTTVSLLCSDTRFSELADLHTRVEAAYARLTAGPIGTRARSRPEALALIGDYPHNPAYIRRALEPVLADAGLAMRVIYDATKFGDEALAGARLLIVLRDGMFWPEPGGPPVWWMTEAQETALADFVTTGGGFLALHNATALKRIDDGPCLYREVLGSSYNGHGPADEAFEVSVTDTPHPVTRGVRPYPAVDERHRAILHADDATVLLEARADGETTINGYARLYGSGRVCYLANGHTYDMLACDAMRRLLTNAARWCAGLTDPPV